MFTGNNLETVFTLIGGFFQLNKCFYENSLYDFFKLKLMNNRIALQHNATSESPLPLFGGLKYFDTFP